MRNRPITNQLDSHGDVIPTEPPANATASDLAELAASARKDPRFSRLLARTSLKWTIIAGIALLGACTSTDWHADEACTYPAMGSDVAIVCQAACDGVTPAEAGSGPRCASAAFNAEQGAGTCNSITTADGTTGCCVLTGPAPGTATTPYFKFFECDK